MADKSHVWHSVSSQNVKRDLLMGETHAWHVVWGKLRDGRPVPKDGEELRFDDEICWCATGLYASKTLYHAIWYNIGLFGSKLAIGEPQFCRVATKEIERVEVDKFVCRSRTILWRCNGKDVEQAVECALQAFDPSGKYKREDFYRSRKTNRRFSFLPKRETLPHYGIYESLYFFLDAVDYLLKKGQLRRDLLQDIDDFILAELTPKPSTPRSLSNF